MKILCCFLALLISLALADRATAQNPSEGRQDINPLVRLLQSKGIITDQEARLVSAASSPGEASELLARLLLIKGVIDQQEYEQTVAALGPTPEASPGVSVAAGRAIPAAARTSSETAALPSGEAKPPPAERDPARQTQTQANDSVTTSGKVPVKLYGTILFNANYVDRGANTVDIPLFAQKRGTSEDQNHQNFNGTLRQSRFGLRYEGTIFQDAKLTGVFEFDLLGGKPAFPNGVNFDIFRLRLAYGRVDWKRNSLEAGQDWAVLAPLNPTTLASYAIPGFSTSGNLWNRIPQIRYEHTAGSDTKFLFTAAVLDPNAGDNAGNIAVRVIGLGERSVLPAFETRIGFATPSHGKQTTAGISGHYSRLLGVAGNPPGTTTRSPIDSYAVSADANVWLTSGLRLTGEFFHGRALGIFSGSIAQSAVVIGGRARGINSTGGWFEFHAEAPRNYDGSWKNVSVNAGYGIENNRDEDLIVGVRKRNQSYMFNGQYKFSPNLTVALEYRRILTDWFLQSFANQKLNWVDLAFLYTF